MTSEMLKMLINIAMKKLTTEQLEKWVDQGLDMIEDKVAGSENQYDDMVILPMCNTIRKAFSIEDND